MNKSILSILIFIIPSILFGNRIIDSYGVGVFYNSYFPSIDESGYYESFPSCCSEEIRIGNTVSNTGYSLIIPFRYDIILSNNFSLPLLAGVSVSSFSHDFLTQKIVFDSENGNNQSLIDINAKSNFDNLGFFIGTGANYFGEYIYADISTYLSFNSISWEYSENLENANGTFGDGTTTFNSQSETTNATLYTLESKVGYPISISESEGNRNLLVPYLSGGIVFGELRDSYQPSAYIGIGITYFFQKYEFFASPIKPVGS